MPGRLTAPANISLAATAADSDGTIVKVEFYQGINLLGTDTTSPYSYSWSGVAAGSYTLTAKATDNAGAATTSASVSITVNSSTPPGGTAFLTGQTLGPLRNSYTGWVGMTFTVGTSVVTVTELGRWVVAGNTQTHTVKLVNAATGADVGGGSAGVNTAGAAGGQYKYAALAAPVTLAANTSYHLVTYETAGGDWWYDWNTRVTTTTVARAAGPVYGGTAGVWYPGTWAAANQIYGPVNFRYGGN